MVRQSHVGPGSWLCEVPQLWSRTAEVWWKEGWQSWSGCPLVESMFAGRRTPPKTPAAQICCFLWGLQIFFLNAVNEMNLWILFGRNFTTFACWKLWTNKTKQAAVCGLSSWLLVPFDYCELNVLFIVFCMTFYTYFLNKDYQFVWLCRHFPA